jgi:hypothetical protein
MPRFLLVALNGPVEGEGADAQYNDWYNDKHAADLLSIDGAVSVRRFKVLEQNRIDKPYINITEFEAESLEAFRSQLAEKASDFTGAMMDRTTSIMLLGGEITKAPRD